MSGTCYGTVQKELDGLCMGRHGMLRYTIQGHMLILGSLHKGVYCIEIIGEAPKSDCYTYNATECPNQAQCTWKDPDCMGNDLTAQNFMRDTLLTLPALCK